MKLYLPFPRSFITQAFGFNANPLYKSQGLKGHTSYDWGAAWGAAVPNCAENAYVYSVLHQANPDPSKYRSVYTLVEDKTGVYEVSYGHFSRIYAEVGRTYLPGDILGLVGNTGAVYSGGKAVSVESRKAGSKDGAHLHGPQVRPVKKVKKRAKDKKYLNDANGPFKKDGYYFEILDYDNGYNGCVAPEFHELLASEWKPTVDKASAIVLMLTKAVKVIASLPVKDRGPWIKSVSDIASGVLKFLKK